MTKHRQQSTKVRTKGIDQYGVRFVFCYTYTFRIAVSSGEFGFPSGSVVKIHLQCRRCRFNSSVGKIPWRKATHSSIIAWKIPWTEESSGLHSMGVTKSRTQLRTHTTDNNQLENSYLCHHVMPNLIPANLPFLKSALFVMNITNPVLF